MIALLDYQGKVVRLTDERLAHIKEHATLAGKCNQVEVDE